MFDEIKIWKLQICAERAWKLAMDLAIESVKLSKRGKGLTYIADETRRIADKLYVNLESIKSGNKSEVDFSSTLEQLNLLAQNGCIELIRLNECVANNWDGLAVSILMDEISLVASELMELFEYKKIRVMEIPEITTYSRITDMGLFLLQATIGGNAFVENIRYIEQIISYTKEDTSLFDFENKILNLRGKKVPVIDCYDKFGLTKPSFLGKDSRNYAVIVNTDWDEANKLYAILVDDIMTNSIFKTRLGVSVQCKSKMFSPKFVRDCWDTADDKQMLFMNWKEISLKN